MANFSDGKYQLILNAAMEVITEKGYDKTVISDIVKKAGVAQGTFYLYFSSKKALIPAIADHLLSITFGKIKEKAQDKESFWDVLEVVISETFDITDSYKEILVLCYSGLAIDHSMEKWEAIYSPYYDWLENILVIAMNNNEIVSDLHAKWTAKLLINLIENAAERFYIGLEQEEPLDVYKTRVFHFIKRSLWRN
ncbi:TetR family transcriptional regulator [Paenibacillus macerans]|uniref:TetR family transcriptional regulator n=1 Tax=Paenibacillus macerans TaxID=44252 RepID=UPI000EEDACA6|nr:TetR family transcriptional regulator [Paenibacillus macerans]MDU5947145.1 TetR family transcriptional regulator [Paenibacillus macerans]GBK60224.1 TetR/AcrR family transcriptional regulator [Paenibacillus macerans]GBK66521.1 TetR/AcrR family transcriptional regulator [Paenibacillus macerans]